jgi:hypothetical protein
MCRRRGPCRARHGERLGVARPGPRAARVQLRPRSVRGRPASRYRHRSAVGRRSCRAGKRDRVLRRDGADGRQDAHDSHRRRLLRDAAPSRLTWRWARRDRGRRRRRGHGRPERRAGVAGALRVPRRAPHLRPAGLPRPASLPAPARGRSARCAAHARACSLGGSGPGAAVCASSGGRATRCSARRGAGDAFCAPTREDHEGSREPVRAPGPASGRGASGRGSAGRPGCRDGGEQWAGADRPSVGCSSGCAHACGVEAPA